MADDDHMAEEMDEGNINQINGNTMQQQQHLNLNLCSGDCNEQFIDESTYQGQQESVRHRLDRFWLHTLWEIREAHTESIDRGNTALEEDT